MNSAPAAYGGFETLAWELGTRLAERGHEVTVYCRRGRTDESIPVPPGIRRRFLPYLPGKYLETVSHTALSMLDSVLRGYDAIWLGNAANAVFAGLPRVRGTAVALNVDGIERQRNPALGPMSREAFIADITQDVPETPVYFLHSRDTNRAGPPILVAQPMPPTLSPDEFARTASLTGATVLDTRSAQAFGTAHVPGALHVGLDGQFASWVGTLVEPGDPVLIVVEPERAEEAVVRLTRVGYENVIGILEGGMASWIAANRPISTIPQVPAKDAIRKAAHVLDVRRDREFQVNHLDSAVHITLAQLPQRLAELEPDEPWTVVCAGGYRSSIAASVLKRAGFADVTNAVGGMDSVSRAN